MRKAANKLAAKIIDAAAVIPWYGKVIKVQGDKVYITPGRSGGVQVGTRLQVIPGWPAGETYAIDNMESFAEIEVVGYIGDRVCTAQLLSGEGVIVGSLIRERRP